MLWIKAFHIVFVMAWMAAVFYLPRILVNLAEAGQENPGVRERLLLMGQRLARFSAILAGVALLLGIWLWLGYGFGGGWLHIKLALVVLLMVYEAHARRLLRQFAGGHQPHTARWLRIYNEISILLATAIVILVVVKPI